VLNATSPVLVMSGAPCHQIPETYTACDHMEESVVPAETFGRRYAVAVPTNPRGEPIGHVVRIYGNVDGTALTYAPAAPAGAPASINAGEVADLGNVTESFYVEGSAPFAVTSFLLGSSIADPGHLTDYNGDPSQSNVQAEEQFRKKYVFLAPDDYNFSFADMVAPDGASCLLDGEDLAAAPSPIGATGFNVVRMELALGVDGTHVLDCDQPVGLQVMGYGFATSYNYPGGVNLTQISDPPIIVE
jgi:hypothetical protein